MIKQGPTQNTETFDLMAIEDDIEFVVKPLSGDKLLTQTFNNILSIIKAEEDDIENVVDLLMSLSEEEEKQFWEYFIGIIREEHPDIPNLETHLEKLKNDLDCNNDGKPNEEIDSPLWSINSGDLNNPPLLAYSYSKIRTSETDRLLDEPNDDVPNLCESLSCCTLG